MQGQKVASTRESNPNQSHLLLHKRFRAAPVVQTEKKLDPANIPWNKDTDDPCNLTFGEDCIIFIHATKAYKCKKAVTVILLLINSATSKNHAYYFFGLSLIHICRCRRYAVCRSRWSPYH
eukprot:TRINITY_DN16659_c0_g3_i3.p1 TRINITY_DN16659_c0_g3~~TRINITY_DN16659_c0_g3_i3.p1  ORF type:complete len:121 (+),score=0.02 TRINITY_DN16659_c0_g3_i3:173-535(+)